MARTLTDRTIKNLTPGEQARYVVDVTGLALRIGAADSGGTKTWSIRYRAGRHQRRLTLGGYPVLSLADARKRAKDALKQVGDGADPAELKQARRDADTVDDFAKIYNREVGAAEEEVLEGRSDASEHRRAATLEAQGDERHHPTRC